MNKLLITCTQKIILGLAFSVFTGAPSSFCDIIPNYQLVWIEPLRGSDKLKRLQTEKNLRDELENKLGIKLNKKPLGIRFVPQAVQFEQQKIKVEQLIQEIYDEFQGSRGSVLRKQEVLKKKFQVLNELIRRLPRSFFSPEIYRAKIIQSAWLWLQDKKGRSAGFKKQLQEAKQLHPEGTLNWSATATPIWWDAFEGEGFSDNQGGGSYCPMVYDEALTSGSQIWANGFGLSELPPKIQNGFYLFVLKNKEGKWFEKGVVCQNAFPISLEAKEWTSLAEHVRLEQGLFSVLKENDEVLILQETSRGIARYLFNSSKGLRDWSEEVLSEPIIRNIQWGAFQPSEAPKWYNKNSTFWIAAAAVLSGTIVWVVQNSGRNEAPPAIQIKIMGGP